MLAFMKLLWRHWKRVVHGINGAISFTLMSVAYILGLGPVAVYFKITRADLLDRGLAEELESYWQELPPDEDDVIRVQRPW
ncbi:MAG: hypothetical protein ACI8RZ_003397 [Myxococcota bacterium]|jgi:hypothetical protein